jgi:hypothetical protein
MAEQARGARRATVRAIEELGQGCGIPRGTVTRVIVRGDDECVRALEALVADLRGSRVTPPDTPPVVKEVIVWDRSA